MIRALIARSERSKRRVPTTWIDSACAGFVIRKRFPILEIGIECHIARVINPEAVSMQVIAILYVKGHALSIAIRIIAHNDVSLSRIGDSG